MDEAYECSPAILMLQQLGDYGTGENCEMNAGEEVFEVGLPRQFTFATSPALPG